MTGQVVDSHLHLIDPDRLGYPWIGTRDELDTSWDAQRFAAEALRVTAAIVVEAGVESGQADREVSWVRSQAAAHPWIRGMVVQLPVEQPGALAGGLSQLRGDDLIAGVRRNLQDEPPGYLGDRDLRDGIRRLGQAGLPFDACVRSWQLTELTELAAACPDTMILLDHLGKPRCGTDLAPWRAAIAALAARPNVRCKLSGLTTAAAATARRGDLIAALRVALDSFRADRCLYGGDWPVCTLATSPDAWLDVVLAALDQAHATEAERAAVMTGTAMRTYPMRLMPATARSEGANR
ncbi:MAG: amidohydrolase family protein [Streptosporangiaceae bacterium]